MYRKLPLSEGPRVLKQTARKLVSLVTTQSCVSLVDTVSSEDSQRSSRNSLQALHESRGCIPSTRFNNRLPGFSAAVTRTAGPRPFGGAGL